MDTPTLKKVLALLAVLAAVWLGARYLLPVLLPFFLGGLLALAAEPVVSLGIKRLKLRRGLASPLGVALTLIFLAGLVVLVAAVLVRQVGSLAAFVPDLEAGVGVLEDWLISVADRAPEGVRPLAQRTVLEFFDDGTALMTQLTGNLPGAVKNLLSGVGSSLLSIGTGILSAFLISARLPRLRAAIRVSLPESWHKTYLPALQKLRKSLLGWLKAQGKLALVTWGVVSLGFFVLRIPYGPMWALLIALVDAVPILGTGIVLIPWAAVSFLQGNTLRGVGLLCTYGVAVITRTVLEPRLMGRQLGLDPLLTLVALYAGFRLWGIPGLLLTPILASAAKSITTKR